MRQSRRRWLGGGTMFIAYSYAMLQSFDAAVLRQLFCYNDLLCSATTMTLLCTYPLTSARG